MTYKLTSIPSFIHVFQADSTTAVADDATLTLAQLQGLTYKTVADANGTGDLTWTVQDSGGTANGGVDTLAGSLSIIVNPVNDAPTFALSGNPPDVDENAGAAVRHRLCQNIVAGPGEESTQILTFAVTPSSTVNPTGDLTFATPPAIDADGNLTYTPTDGTSGTATFDVVLSDDGSDTSPNVNHSSTLSFTITVTPEGEGENRHRPRSMTASSATDMALLSYAGRRQFQ